ncbi:hypothetical protein V8C42DRAFT_335135 [Trichoderma barbatum]
MKPVKMTPLQAVGYGVVVAEVIGHGNNDRVFNVAHLVFESHKVTYLEQSIVQLRWPSRPT